MQRVDRLPHAPSPVADAQGGRDPYRVSVIAASVTCALTPAYTIRWHYGFYPTTLLETFILLTVLVFAFETWKAHLPLAWRSPFTWPAALFIAAGAIAVIAAPDRRAALGLYRAYLLEPIAFFFVVSAVARTARRAQLVLAGLGLAVLVVGVANAVVVLDAIRHHSLNLAGTPPVVIYQTSNAVALLMLPVMAVAGSLVLYAQEQRTRLVAAAFLAITVPCFLLTLSRGGYVALFSVALALALTHPRRLRLALFGALALLIFVAIPPIRTRLGHEFDPADPNNTLVGRSYLWRATIQMLQHRPLTGAGLSGFATEIAPYWNATHTDRFIDPHNILLNFWSETGILGVVAFAWILVQGFMVSLRGWRQGAMPWRAIQLGVALALVGFIVHGLVDVPYFKNDLSLEFWALMGVSWAGIRWGGVSTRRAAGRVA